MITATVDDYTPAACFYNPDYLVSPTQTNLKTGIREMIQHVQRFTPDSSPGVPYMMVGLSNAQVIDRMGEQLVDLVYERLKALELTSRTDLLDCTREQLVKFGYMDPVRVFVKDEPHKLEKLTEGRVRIIHSVSLVDKLVEMLLIKHATKQEIRHWKLIPSKPGIGFDDESNLAVYNDVMTMDEPHDSDVKGWDMGVKFWMMEDDAHVTINLCRNAGLWWTQMLLKKQLLEASSIFQFSDGTMVYPNYRGIVNSGKFKTSYSNSKMRVLVSKHIGAKQARAAGDDCVESKVNDAIEKYKLLGIKIKSYQPIHDRFEFCSHMYTPSGSYAINDEKMIMNFLHNDLSVPLNFRMWFAGLYGELGSRPDWDIIVERLRSIGLFDLEGGQILE